MPKDYRAIDSVRRRLPGTEHRQRPQSQKVEPLKTYQEDHVYHAAQVGRIVTEMVRPSVKGIVDKRRYGGWDYERLRIAGLARSTSVQKTQATYTVPIDAVKATLHVYDICRQRWYTDENGTAQLYDEVLSAKQIFMPVPLEQIYASPIILRGV